MNEQRNNLPPESQVHRRLSPSAKRKRRKAKMRRRMGILLSGMVLVMAFVIVGYLALTDETATTAGSPDSTDVTQELDQKKESATQAPDTDPSPESEVIAEQAQQEGSEDVVSSTADPNTQEEGNQPEPSMENINITWDTTGIEGFDYLIAINRAADTVTVYTKDENNEYRKPYFAMICSTGEDTPLGEYRTIEQYRWRALFGDVYGQYAVRIVEHILFHSVPYLSQDAGDLEYEEFNKLGTPASMGCIRLQVADVKWIYDNCPIGTPVVLYDDAENPGPFGKPAFTKLDLTDETMRGWDPTDPDPKNPWANVEPRPKTQIPE